MRIQQKNQTMTIVSEKACDVSTERKERMSGSELLLYGGIIAMITAAIGGIACAVVFTITGQNLKMQLDQEYGPARK